MNSVSIKFISLFFFLSCVFSAYPIILPLLISPLDITETRPDWQTPEKNKSQKAITSWGGSALSQETRNIDGFDATVYSLSGGAYILHRKVKLSANSIEIIGQDAYKGLLKGGVKVEDTENNLTLTASRGVYDKFEETIILEGRPLLYHKDKSNKITKVSAPYIKRYLAENKTLLEKGVIVENSDYVITGETAEILEKEDLIKMENYPYIFGKDIFLTGERISYVSSARSATLEKDTLLIRNDREKTKSKSSDDDKTEEEEIKLVKSIFTGEKIVFQSGSEEEKYVGIFGNAKIIRDDYEFTASYIKAHGKSFKNLEAKDTVNFLDKTNHVRLAGNIFEFDDASSYTHVTEDARIEFMDKENKEVNSTLTSVEIERFFDKKEIVARGNVTIDSKESKVKGEYATYFEADKRIYVEGNPSLVRDNKAVNCGRVIIYPNENRIILSNGLNVNGQK